TLAYGNLTNEQFVTLVYQNVLGRAPDPGGFTLWTGELAAGRLTRAQVMDGFVRSAELDLRIRNRGYAYLLYVAFLRRSGGSAEVDFWADRLTTGQSTLPQLVGNFIDSAEYKLRFQ
ncbi:MAG TPA: DUF4214 domain-containing protein, partial [Bryobacteraceae bacterium]|nr:DUF4214 domain-containing protein [Bryobacteraceae bacterium]